MRELCMQHGRSLSGRGISFKGHASDFERQEDMGSGQATFSVTCFPSSEPGIVQLDAILAITSVHTLDY